MNRIIIKKMICVVSEEELTRMRAAQRQNQHPNVPARLLSQHVWREIVASATSEGVRLTLGNVDEEAAVTGYSNIRYACKDINFTWPDLADVDGLENLMQFEPMVVGRKVLEILAHLREMSPAVKDVLAV